MKPLLLLGLCLLARFACAEPLLQVQAHLVPATGVVVGQTVALQVDVLTDTWFSSAPQLPTLDLPGARVLPPDDQAQHLTLKVDGKTLFGMRYTWRITPQQAQALRIPALTIQATPGQASAPLSARSPPLQLEVSLPAGAPVGKPLLVAQALTFTQQISYSATPPKAGDSVTRTLTLQAEGALSLSLPTPTLAEVNGLSRYLKTPQVLALDDGRGHVRGGQRIDSVTYRIDQAGRFELPAINLAWWNVASQQMATAQLPAVAFQAAAATSAPPVFSIREDLKQLGSGARLHLARYWLALASLLALVAALVCAARAFMPHAAHCRQQARLHYRALRKALAPRELRPLNPRLDKEYP
ncbi:MAG: BatD family protein [Pseudomonas sp.]|uniref:BatD family protein n=1 Tax=Pseudomonas abieticivorans TaxID=2931382 RepID=UPI0020BEFE53|nr:BatD family protein [Pseudomonas sp. PIA16]MDE1167307.1 BatD family protein [Pseudomonas sp.]